MKGMVVRLRVFAVAAMLGTPGCAFVPTLTFVDADAAQDDATSEGPPGADSAAGDVACPGSVPPGASVCCGAVACNGNCTATQCASCAAQCGSETLCCAHTNNVSCRPLDSPCP